MTQPITQDSNRKYDHHGFNKDREDQISGLAENGIEDDEADDRDERLACRIVLHGLPPGNQVIMLTDFSKVRNV